MVEQGIRNNLGQFLLLVLANFFVGAMVGQERSVLTPLAGKEFGVASRAAALGFLVSFGAAKAICNLLAGRLADRLGRRQVLVWGWVCGLPVPLIIILARQWALIMGANVLLGINQGLCWSATVLMKLDLAGRRRAGLATAANEWAGYVGVAAAAWVTGFLAAAHGLRPVPFYLGIATAVAGLLISLLIRPTEPFVEKEARSACGSGEVSISLGAVVRRTLWADRNLFAASQAGLCSNLKDGLFWGLLPISLHGAGLSFDKIGIITAVYPAVWGFCQLGSGPLSDRLGRKWLIVSGMTVQGAGLLFFVGGSGFAHWLTGAAVTGLGTALAYPVLLAAVSDIAPPAARGSFLGGYRFWRDGGYALAGLGLGPAADAFSPKVAIAATAALALLSGLTASLLMAPRLHRMEDGSQEKKEGPAL
ncbi:MAG: MFS transporter [Desulfobacteraceae bacterium]|nr:MFS transporter [Desulfobacteraceae bacterium]